MKLRAIWFFLCSTLLFSAEGTLPEVTLLQPSDKTVFLESIVTVSVDTEGKAFDRIGIALDQNRTAVLPREAGKSVYCKSMPLKPGMNTLQVTLYQGEKPVGRTQRDLFHVVEVFENCEEPPYGYERRVFHTAQSEKRCSACHSFESPKNRMKVPEGAPEPDGITLEIRGETFLVPANPQEVSCYRCHKNLLAERKNSHAPSVNWLCSECHTGDNGAFNEGEATSRLSAPDPIMTRCFGCHENSESNWFNHRSEHGPTKTGRCTMCHNPHASNNEFFLRKPIWKLCTTCHAEKADGKHVIGSFVFSRNAGGHPTQGRKDPARPGRELVCSSCHNPHGSDGVFLLRAHGPLAYNVCRRCHQK